MEGNLPSPDYAYDMEWKWPWAKFELPPNALFTTLQERFNTRQCPIQDPYAFHQDVCESADYSATLEEFILSYPRGGMSEFANSTRHGRTLLPCSHGHPTRIALGAINKRPAKVPRTTT